MNRMIAIAVSLVFALGTIGQAAAQTPPPIPKPMDKATEQTDKKADAEKKTVEAVEKKAEAMRKPTDDMKKKVEEKK